MIRSTTDAMLAERHDKNPQRVTLGTDAVPHVIHRVECIPSRDPQPWLDPFTKGDAVEARWAVEDMNPKYSYLYEWAPRLEFARPEPNPILVAFREDEVDPCTFAESWIEAIDSPGHCIPEVRDRIDDAAATPEQIADARKVLTRLAAVQS